MDKADELKNPKKRKYHIDETSSDEDSITFRNMKPKPESESEFKPKHRSLEKEQLRGRIRGYLRDHCDKQYIEIDDMAKHLHCKYNAYRRLKYKIFYQNVNSVFEDLKREAEKGAMKANDEPSSSLEGNHDNSKMNKQSIGSEVKRVKPGPLSKKFKSSKAKMDKKNEELTAKSQGQVETIVIAEGKSSEEKEIIVEVENKYSGDVKNKGSSDVKNKGSGDVKNKDSGDVKNKGSGDVKNKGSGDVKNGNSGAEDPMEIQVLSELNKQSIPSEPFHATIKQVRESSLSSKDVKDTSQFKQVQTPKKEAQTPSGNRKLLSKPSLADRNDDDDSKIKPQRPIKKYSSKKQEVVIPTISNITFKDIGGCADIIEKVYRLTRYLVFPQNIQQIGGFPSRGAILHGPPGCGKTIMAQAISGSLKVPMLSVMGTELISGISGDTEAKLRDLFEEAKSSAPCILFIDGVDVVAKKRGNAQREMEMRIVRQLLTCLDDLSSSEFEEEVRVFVLGATDNLDAIDPALRTGNRLAGEIAMGIPDVKARQSILEVICKKIRLENDVHLSHLATLTPGFVASDLKALATTACGFAENRHNENNETIFRNEVCDEPFPILNPDFVKWVNSSEEVKFRLENLFVTSSDFEKALKLIKPAALREGFATVPNVTFQDIGAVDHIIHGLGLEIQAPIQFPDLTSEMGLDVPSGVLFCGPPGCGKTLLAKAVANQAGINFISVKGPEMLNMYVGESERAVRQVFQRAKNSAPCVIFFDEIDSICPKRSGNDNSSSNRIVNQLLTEMDGVEERKGVFVMAATNRVDMLDEAVLRPGRLTNITYVGLPDCKGREDILVKLTKKGTKPRLGPDVNLQEIAAWPDCDGFSGADLANFVRTAAKLRMFDICQNQGRGEKSDVGLRYFELALKEVRPSVSSNQKKVYELMEKKYSKRKATTPKKSASEESAIPEKPSEETAASKEASEESPALEKISEQSAAPEKPLEETAVSKESSEKSATPEIPSEES